MNRNASIFENGMSVVHNLAAGYLKCDAYDRIYAVFATAGAATDLSFLQATDRTGTDAKAVNVSRYWAQIGAPGPGVLLQEFDVVDADNRKISVPTINAASAPGVADTGANPSLVVVELQVDTLDVNNGFIFVNCANASHFLVSGADYISATPANPVED